MPVSSIVAIGDELVGGFTLDTNSHWMAERLRILGYPVKRVTQIRDRPQEIVEQLRRELDDAEITDVFVSGGLGPTPDDRTFAALATALGKELMIWEETRARIERRVQRMHSMGLLESPDVTEGNLRMARIPAGPSHVFKNRRGMAPGGLYEANGKRIFVLPGVPLELKGIFTEELEPQFLTAGSAATVRELRFTFAVEARFYPLMRELEEQFPDVSVGSYPNFETKELVIRCIGLDPKRVEAALDVIRRRAPV
jgi:molybdenum cofactor synthesis domain-containing protein